MDALKAQIASQKRKIAEEQNERNKYMRRGDLQAIASEGRAHTVEEIPATSPLASEHKPCASQGVTIAEHGKAASTQDEEATRESLGVTSEEVMSRLRERAEPIRLFGESEKERVQRLRAVEQECQPESQKEEDAHVERKSMEEVVESAAERPASQEQDTDTSNKDRIPARMREGVGMHAVMDLKLMWSDQARVYPIIYYTLKGLLEDWETELNQRPDIVKRSEKGQKMSELHAQTAVNLKPLLKLLRRRSVESDVLLRIAEIVHYMQQREYRKANDSYLQLSIGNAPWPIGITMAGIHERSADEKLQTSKVAHVLNDEVSRKYIQSLKRLMTFAQSHIPTLSKSSACSIYEHIAEGQQPRSPSKTNRDTRIQHTPSASCSGSASTSSASSQHLYAVGWVK